LTALKEAVEKTDKDKIQQAIEDLNAYTAPLAHRAMDETIQAAMQGKKVSGT
jgi:molecular chaperone HscA